jgi:hypothetical protein
MGPPSEGVDAPVFVAPNLTSVGRYISETGLTASAFPALQSVGGQPWDGETLGMSVDDYAYGGDDDGYEERAGHGTHCRCPWCSAQRRHRSRHFLQHLRLTGDCVSDEEIRGMGGPFRFLDCVDEIAHP